MWKQWILVIIVVCTLCARVNSLKTFDPRPSCRKQDDILTCKNLTYSANDQMGLRFNIHYEHKVSKTIIITNSSLPIVPRFYLVQTTSISINNCKVKELNRTYFEASRVLATLDLSNNEIVQLPSKVFSVYNALQDISLSNNQISDMEWDCFQRLDKLKKLNLSKNKIKVVNINLFSDLATLEQIDLSYNEIEILDPDTFAYNKMLKDIDLSRNRILDIRFVICVDKLERLNLASNMITKLNNIVFMNLTKVKEINLQANSINIIDSSAFDNTMSLESLDLSQNQIQEIETKTFQNMESLKNLELSGNKLENYNFLTFTPNLRRLDLSMNYLGPIGIELFSNMTNLLYLNLSKTNVKGLDYGTFSHQDNLNIMDLSYNKLEDINIDIFSPIKQLEYLYLDGNDLVEIDYEELIDTHKTLIQIGLVYNNWNCQYLSQLLKFMKAKRIDIKIETHKVTKNDTNISGIRCWPEDNPDGFLLDTSSNEPSSSYLPRTDIVKRKISNSMVESCISINHLLGLVSAVKNIAIFLTLLVFIALVFLVSSKVVEWKQIPRRSYYVKEMRQSSILNEEADL